MRPLFAVLLLLSSVATGAPLISEIMYHPRHQEGREDSQEEWIEIYNPGHNPVDLTNWTLSGAGYTFPNISLGAKAYLVLASDPATFSRLYPDVEAVIGGWNGHLSNRGEELVLRDDLGEKIDQVSYSAEGDWAQRRPGPDGEGWIWQSAANAQGHSLELRNLTFTNSSGLNWRASSRPGGTPGAPNSIRSLNDAPLIQDVRHHPTVPGPNDMVMVQARLTDDLSQARGIVHHRISSEDPQEFKQAPMRDDGQEGDPVANDGVFSALLPVQPTGTVVEFYIEASDRFHQRTWPNPTHEDGTQGANLLYQVDSEAHEEREPLYRLVLSSVDHGKLSRDEIPEHAHLNATFIAQTGSQLTTIYQCGVRSPPTSDDDSHPQDLLVSFPGLQTWNGHRAMHLQSQFTFNQLLTSRIYREAGLPIPECKPVQVRINGTNHASPENGLPEFPHDRHYGIYVQNEVLSGRFADTHFPNHEGGNLYRMGEDGTAWRHFPNSQNLGADYRGMGWEKANNFAADDWTDLHRFLGKVTGTPGPNSLSTIEQVLDLESWLRTLAVATILSTGDESLFTGNPSNFALYQRADGRFQLLASNFQTVLGQGHADDRLTIEDLPGSIYPFLGGDELADGPLQALFSHQEVVVHYLQILEELLHGPLRENRIHALVDDALAWTPPVRAATAKSFFSARRTDILTQIQRPLTIDSDLSLQDGYHSSTINRVTLRGSFNATSASLFINGQPAQINRLRSEWSLTDLPLLPGLNRITIEEFDAEGELLRQSHLDVHYDDGDAQSIGGLLSQDTTLKAEEGPWRVSSNLVVPTGKTLTIEPGTSLYFDSGAGITVRPGGTLQALGDRYLPIRFGIQPGQSERWDGLRFNAPSGQQSTTPNLLRHVVMEHGDRQGEAISVQRSQLTLESVTWDHMEQPILDVISPQLLVEHCHFPVIANAEVFRGRTLVDDDYCILRGNTFSASSHHQDIVRFSNSRRPGPILAAYDNLFLGAADDCFDLDRTDAHLEGNVFKNVHLDTPRPSSSNAIVANNNSHLTVVRNLFHDVDHALLLKNGADCVFEHNTIVRATIAAISFDEPERSNIQPGKRIDLESNIFLDCQSTFAHATSQAPEPNPVILGHRNILPAGHHGIGSENLDQNPNLRRQEAGPWPKSNWSLEPGSPAQGTGRNGNDRGALIPPGAIASAIPGAVIQSQSALVFPVRGPGLSAYRWRLVINGVPGDWSNDQFPGTPIRLSRLVPGTYSIQIVAKDSANHWQEEFTSSPTWQITLNPSGSLVLNEVAAVSSPGTDAVELLNGTSTRINLNGWFLTDNPLKPTKVPLSGFIGPFQQLERSGGEVPKLAASGDSLFLFHGGRLVDSVSWGLQVDGYTIGRDREGNWGLTEPTLGDPNKRAGLAPIHQLRINEWLATANLHYDKEFVELYNPSDAPIPLHGLWISDSPDRPLRHPLPALSFIGAGDFAVYHPTSDVDLEADELPFSLNGFYEAIVLSDSQGRPIDHVSLSCLHPDVVEGRNPDGSHHIQSFSLGTPGRSNHRELHHNVSSSLISFLENWHYLDRSVPAEGWDIMKSFDLSAWEEGPAPLGRETSSLPYPLATNPNTIPDFDYARGRKNYYFRRTFEFNGDPVDTFLTLSTYLDDGAVFYLNGHELYRHNLPKGPIDQSTWALETIDNAVREGPFEVPNDHLINGTNVLTVVTYQATQNSSDVVMDCELTAIRSVPAPPDPEEVAMLTLMDYLRITEVMYNPPDGQDAEFIEIQNISRSLTLDITGVRLEDAVSFTFPEYALSPGERVVVVNNTGHFQVVHGRNIKIAGEFEGRLGNNSELIALSLPEPWDVSIHRFAYQSEWFAQTNSFGRSLEISDPNLPLTAWNTPFAWSESFRLFGTPGAENSSSDFQAWMETLGGEPGDQDRDGLPDLFEYAYDFDPDEPDFQAILSKVNESPDGLSATFLIPAVAPADAVFHLQSSPDMENWITHASRFGNETWTGPTSVQAHTPETGLGLVTIHFPNVAPKLYTRMVIEIKTSLPLAGP